MVDASGSHAAQQRMRAVKGAVAALLKSSVDHHFLPTGGRTPLAHALELVATLETETSLVVLATDARANVPLRGTDPWEDALAAATALSTKGLLVDSSLDKSTAGAIETLAAAMRRN